MKSLINLSKLLQNGTTTALMREMVNRVLKNRVSGGLNRQRYQRWDHSAAWR
jgi:hypothetical protein